MRKSNWNTYGIEGYSHQVGSDQRATGGIQYYQVKQDRSTKRWYKRVADGNGQFFSPGTPQPIDAEEGEALFFRAKERN